MNFLKKLFGSPGSGPWETKPTTGQNLTSVIVTQSALEALDESPYALVQSVITFVNAMLNDGRYRHTELPQNALDSYHVDYYLAQVNNGGHSQFTHNAAAHLDDTIASVLRGLEAMGATPYLEIAQTYANWLRDNPNESAAQTGFTGGRAEALDTLDSAFFGLGDNALIQKNARWIASWSTLRAVPDADHARHIQETAALNPLRADRQLADKATGLRTAFQTPMNVGFSMASWLLSPPRPLRQIGGGSFETVDGQQATVWTLGTFQGDAMFGVINSDGARLFERIEHSKPVNINDPEALKTVSFEDIQNFKAPERGTCLAQLGDAAITHAMALCDRMNAADAAVLLEQSLEGISFVSINVKSVGKTNKGQDAVTLFAVTNTGSLIEVLVRSGDAAAFDFAQDKVLSVVDAKQIEAFRKQVSRHTV